ncbi:MAG TPA: hypothetical protein VF787_09200 [Thermoanaerobaculia bacterium]
MQASTPEVLIARHVEKLRARPDREKLDQVLSRSGLKLDGEHVARVTGHDITSADCMAYKRAVRDVYGDATYAFTKVNFVLGGCTCRDCAAQA